MHEPLMFSLLVPTRNRADTLSVALQTCLGQDFDDFEVVVCDNFGGPETYDVVSAIESPKLRYVRSERPLALSENWELAVSKARGRYVTVIGDDDALTPHALRTAATLIERYEEPEAIRWSRAMYTWPTIALHEYADRLSTPLDRSVQWVTGRQQLRKVANFEAGPDTLPMIYSSFVRRDRLDDLRSRVGRLFPTRYPDIYSAFALGYICRKYLSLSFPLGVAGLSHHSNGMATLYQDSKPPVARDFNDLNTAAGIKFHEMGPQHEWFFAHIQDSFLYAQDLVYDHDPSIRLDMRRMLTMHLEKLPPLSADDHRDALAELRRTASAEPEVQGWFDAHAHTIAATQPELVPAAAGWDGARLTINTSVLGIVDVFGAAALVGSLIGETAANFTLDEHVWPPSGAAVRAASLPSGAVCRPSSTDFASYFTDGWSESEESHIWSDASVATMVVPLDENAQLWVDVSAFLGGVPREQHVDVLVDGKTVAQWMFNESDNRRVRSIQVDASPSGKELVFRIANSTSPWKLGISEDKRNLGVAIHGFGVG